MTDLSLASHEEIVAELGRRYPCYVLVVIHTREGMSGLHQRCDFSRNRGIHEPYGLALMAAGNILRISEAQPGYVATGTPPLDPPIPPRPPTA
jgi:hypothetical protein